MKKYTFCAVYALNLEVEAENPEEAEENAWSRLNNLYENQDLNISPSEFELDFIDEEDTNE